MVKWHRHEAIPLVLPCMPIERFHQPSDQPPLMVILIAILKSDDRLVDLTLRPVSRPRPLEVPLPLRAMRANECRGILAQGGIRIAALPAKRRLDTHRLALPTFRQRKRKVQCALGPVSGNTDG